MTNNIKRRPRIEKLETIMSSLDISPDFLSRIFRSCFTLTPKEYRVRYLLKSK